MEGCYSISDEGKVGIKQDCCEAGGRPSWRRNMGRAGKVGHEGDKMVQMTEINNHLKTWS